MTPPTSFVFITRLPRGALCRPALATMTRRALFFALFVLSTLVGGAVARIQDEPVEKDGRELIPIAMDFGFEEEGAFAAAAPRLADSPARRPPPSARERPPRGPLIDRIARATKTSIPAPPAPSPRRARESAPPSRLL